jgi:thiosulfate/3-mercaptopyruvate sulfurtransferase
MKFNLLFLIIFGWVVTCNPDLFSQTQQVANEILVSTDWLEENLSDPLMIVLHYGNRTDFEKEHIPGARHVSIRELMVDYEQGLRHELPEGQIIEQVLRTWGINTNSIIVICYDNENAIPMATRLFLTLDYTGLAGQVSILNGGLKAWKSDNKTVTQSETAFREGNIEIKIKEEILIYGDEILANLDNEVVKIVDARPEEQYSGKKKDHNSSRKGHIAGAINIPFSLLTVKETPHVFKTKDDLHKLFVDHGIQAGSTIIAYCGSGVWASPVYFAFRFLGYKVRFYDGSMQEWGNDESLPIQSN